MFRAETEVYEPAHLVVEHLPRAERGRACAHDTGLGLRVDARRLGGAALARGELVPGGVPLVRAAAEVAEVEVHALDLDDAAKDRDGHDEGVAGALGAVAAAVGHHAHFLVDDELRGAAHAAQTHVEQGAVHEAVAVGVEGVQDGAGLQRDEVRGERPHRDDLLHGLHLLDVRPRRVGERGEPRGVRGVREAGCAGLRAARRRRRRA